MHGAFEQKGLCSVMRRRAAREAPSRIALPMCGDTRGAPDYGTPGAEYFLPHSQNLYQDGSTTES